MYERLPKKLFENTVKNLNTAHPLAEAKALSYLILDEIYKLSRTDFIINAPFSLSESQAKLLETVKSRLVNHEPVQYIFNQARFYGNNYYVNESVLIPRQETEILVQHLSRNMAWNSPRILDIGTGSGCIACSLALEIQNATMMGYDISRPALEIAQRNATNIGCRIAFYQLDILNENIKDSALDLIVSNPPYVTNAEKEEMKPNVLKNEPALALFVSDDEPLIFYSSIIQKGRASLKKNGMIFFEINEKFGNEIVNLFGNYGYSEAKIYDDFNGKPRFVSAKLK